jgi:hypothetical protein
MMIDLFIERFSCEQLVEKYNKGYEINCYSRWITGEIGFLVYMLGSKIPFKRKLGMLKELLFSGYPGKVTYDTLHLRDPLPFIGEVFGAIQNSIMSASRRIVPSIDRPKVRSVRK